MASVNAIFFIRDNRKATAFGLRAEGSRYKLGNQCETEILAVPMTFPAVSENTNQ